MNRQIFLFACLFGLALCWHTLTLAEQPHREFSEGLDYHKIEPALDTHNDDNRVEVIVLFLYACPHCNALESQLNAWANARSDYISLKRMPAIVGAPWADQARAYFTAEKLGIIDTAHPALFKSIHADDEQYSDEDSVMRFFVNQGVKPENFTAAYHSTEVDEKVSHARIMTAKYGIRGVPAIIVNGKYKTALYYTGTQDKLLAVMDFLVNRERDMQK